MTIKMKKKCVLNYNLTQSVMEISELEDKIFIGMAGEKVTRCNVLKYRRMHRHVIDHTLAEKDVRGDS